MGEQHAKRATSPLNEGSAPVTPPDISEIELLVRYRSGRARDRRGRIRFRFGYACFLTQYINSIIDLRIPSGRNLFTAFRSFASGPTT